MNVRLSLDFAKKLKNFPIADQQKIFAFMEFVELHGLDALQGRNKSSDNVPKDDVDWLEKVQYAQQHNLWHYHIGIPHYRKSKHGDLISEYILHYQRYDDEIILVAMSYHPPFELPSIQNLI